MKPLPIRLYSVVGIFTLLFLGPGLLVLSAAAADVDLGAYYLGDSISLYGYSYLGDSVYMFLTGPGLPENGVTLTDISLRADQGYFTVINVDENQAFNYIWKTSRIASQIDEGTYTVYVTNQPVDLSHLGSEKSYKTITVFLKDSGVSKVSITAEHAYTLNPEETVTTLLAVQPKTSPTPAATLPTVSTIPETAEQKAIPPTTADTGPLAAVTALFLSVVLCFVLKSRF